MEWKYTRFDQAYLIRHNISFLSYLKLPDILRNVSPVGVTNLSLAPVVLGLVIVDSSIKLLELVMTQMLGFPGTHPVHGLAPFLQRLGIEELGSRFLRFGDRALLMGSFSGLVGGGLGILWGLEIFSFEQKFEESFVVWGGLGSGSNLLSSFGLFVDLTPEVREPTIVIFGNPVGKHLFDHSREQLIFSSQLVSESGAFEQVQVLKGSGGRSVHRWDINSNSSV